jgi:hypothetical protein
MCLFFYLIIFPRFEQAFFGAPGRPSPACFGFWQTVHAAMVLDVTEDLPFIIKASELGDLIGKLGGFICEGVGDGGGKS